MRLRRAICRKAFRCARRGTAPRHDGEGRWVSEAALKWLFGEGPDENGYWFGDYEDGSSTLNEKRPAFWWRSKFRAMLSASPAAPTGAGMDERDGSFLDKWGVCKVCDGEIPDGHTENCDIWKIEKRHRDFIANEYNAVLIERDALHQSLAEREKECERLREVLAMSLACPECSTRARRALGEAKK